MTKFGCPRRWWSIAFLIACGGNGDGRKASAPELHNVNAASNAPAPRREPRECRDAIEAWYFAAGVVPRSTDNQTDYRGRQQIFVDGCERDGWSQRVRDCFKHLRVSVDRDSTSALSDCKELLTPEQLGGYKRRIEQTGDTELDKLD